MSLKEKLLAKQVPRKLITVDGDQYEIVGLSRLDRAKMLAARPENTTDLEKAFLCACVCDPETHAKLIEHSESDKWDNVPAGIVARFVVAIREVNYLDEDDLPEKK